MLTGKSVCKITWPTKTVLNMTFGKWWYSEIRLNEKSKYVNVEHFYQKNNYPDKVMAWGNLLPSCKRCNGIKRDHDSLTEPIINPFVTDPKEHLFMKNYRYYSKSSSDIGNRTMKAVGLNKQIHLLNPRIKDGIAGCDALQNLLDLLQTSRSLHYIKGLKSLLKKGNRKEEYAASRATVILSGRNFRSIETLPRSNNLREEELQALKAELQFYASLERPA